MIKNLILAIVIFVIGAGLIIEQRYTVVVHSPVVAKLDRFTGDVWIVNSGIWRKVQPPPENGQQEKPAAAKEAAK